MSLTAAPTVPPTVALTEASCANTSLQEGPDGTGEVAPDFPMPVTENKLVSASPPVKQVWYADDSQGAGDIPALKSWWEKVELHGPAFGYYPKASKSLLVVKPGVD